VLFRSFLTTQGGISDYPKVLDFGLAKVTEREMRPGSLILTQEGMVFGTPEFMSPEQARGEKLDGRSDIYSLGIIMYELLTGKLPFDANQPMEFIQKHIKEPPLPLAKRAPNREWPPGLWEVLEKSLAKKVDQRFATANEFAGALKNVISPTSQPPAPSSVSQPVSISPTPMQASPTPVQAPSGHGGMQPAASMQPQAAPLQSPQAAPIQAAPPSGLASNGPPVGGLGATPKVAWLVLGLGALLALLGTAALVIAILLR
jgi:serine/threonine-protein kinase